MCLATSSRTRRPSSKSVRSPADKPSVNSVARSQLALRVLANSWHPAARATDLSADELRDVAPLLLGSGSGALAWCKIRHSQLQSSPVAFQFQQAYRHHTLEAARHERDIQTILALLRSRGIEPILIKGWSIARLYPEKGMRPYDDTDLVIRRDQYSIAQTIVQQQRSTEFTVDLHNGLEEYGDDSEVDFFTRSRLVKLGEAGIRVPSPEDSLRLLCLHFLRHGAFRPLWLCDVAVAVESRPADFDWDRCFGRKKRVADWIACTIGLAHKLLGARVDDTPVKRRAESLPSWLIPVVLKQWEKPFARDHGVARHRASMATYVRRPLSALGDIRTRWPNAIEATVHVGAPFNELPRLPFQIGECVSRAVKFVARFPEALRDVG